LRSNAIAPCNDVWVCSEVDLAVSDKLNVGKHSQVGQSETFSDKPLLSWQSSIQKLQGLMGLGNDSLCVTLGTEKIMQADHEGTGGDVELGEGEPFLNMGFLESTGSEPFSPTWRENLVWGGAKYWDFGERNPNSGKIIMG
jgi:hypothetical protein